jgi:hypothetical protein
VAFLALYDEAVIMPPEEEKERAKEYVVKNLLLKPVM